MKLHIEARYLFYSLLVLFITGFANSSPLYDIESIKNELNCGIYKDREIIVEEKQNGIMALCVNKIEEYRNNEVSLFIKIESENKSVGRLLNGKPIDFEYHYKFNSSRSSWDPERVVDHRTGESWDGSHIAITIDLFEIHPALKREASEASSPPRACGDVIELNYLAEVDGILNYYNNKSGELLMNCGGICESGRGSEKNCSQCPPKEWVCKE